MNQEVDKSILAHRPARRRRPSRLVVAVVGAVLVVAGAALWLSSGGQTRPGRLVGANLAVSADAGDPLNISANNSPSVARNPVDPANLVVANRIDLPFYSCALHASFDGGSTWAGIPVPFPDGEELPARCYAPDVAYSPDGTLHMAYVTLKGTGNSPNAVWVVSSTDGGRTLSVPLRATGPLAFQVRLTADPARAGRLHLTWLQAEEVGVLLFPTTNNPIQMATSDDAGATWSQPVRVSSPDRARVVAPSPTVGPQGQRYVLYLDLGEDRLDYAGAHQGRGGEPYQGTWSLILARSTDQGQTWQETVVDGAVRPTQRFVVFLPPSPDLVVDPVSGNLYAAFADSQEGDPDVFLWASTDGGATFAARRRVNDTPVTDGTAQYLPKLALAPGGRVDIIYYDRRDDPANLINGVSLQTSADQGRSFTPRIRITDSGFDSRVGPGSERDFTDLGSRLALVSSKNRTLAVWTDTRAGTDVTSKQDLARAIVQVPTPARPSQGLRALSAAMIIAGLATAVVAARLRSRHPPAEPEVEDTPDPLSVPLHTATR